jgi:hypothetical protein
MRIRRRQTMFLLAALAASTRSQPGLASTTGTADGPMTRAAAAQARLWQVFAKQLAAQSLAGFTEEHFKVTGGLTLADWESIDYTGLLPTAGTPGTPIVENIYGWADAMPDYTSRTYTPSRSFYRQYAALVNALTAKGTDQAIVDAAKTGLTRDQMQGIGGLAWPAYRITPRLQDFMVASLQSLVEPEPVQIHLSIDLPLDCPGVTSGELFAARGAAPASAPAGLPFFGVDRTDVAGSPPAVLPRREPAPASTQGLPIACGTARIEFKAQAAQVFNVRPGQWYDSAIASAFGDRIDPASALAGKPLFGPQGFLNLRTSHLLVAVGRTATIRLGPAQLARCAAQAMAPGRNVFNIGGFCFDSAYSDIEAGADSLVFRDNTSAPYVVGVATIAISGSERPG